MSQIENIDHVAEHRNSKTALADLAEKSEPPKKRGRKPKVEKKPAKRGPKPGAKKAGKKRGPKPGAKRGRKPKSAPVMESVAITDAQPWPGLVAYLLVGAYRRLGLLIKAYSEWQDARGVAKAERLLARQKARQVLIAGLVA